MAVMRDGEYCSFGDKESINFLKKVKKNKETGCWEWQGGIDDKGYARQQYNGKYKKAHTVSWLIFRSDEEIPDGTEPDHLCRVRKCVNPFHIEWVTHLVNIRRGKKNQNYNATRCSYGHEFTVENTSMIKRADGREWRRCLTCHRNRAYNRRSNY